MKDFTEDKVQKLRWWVLLYVCLVLFGCYYAYDSVVPIADQIIKTLNITRAQYGLFFSYYSLPNLLMVLLGGMLLDRIGIRKAGSLFSVICLLGILMTAAGATFYVMVWGRFLYGIGAESLLVVIIKILSKWFRGKELSFAFGLHVTVVRLGNTASLNVGAPLYEWTGSWRLALWIAVAIIFVSLIIFLIYSRVDKSTEAFFGAGGRRLKSERFSFRDIFKFKPSYWFVTFLCVTFYSAVLPFIAFSNIFLQKKFGLTATQGGFYISLLFISTMIFTPVLGFIIDKVGKRATIMIAGSLMIIPIFLVLGLSTVNPAVPIAFLGIAFSLVPAALWASIPIMIEENRLGTAYGLVVLIQNVGLTLFPWIAGKVTDLSGGDYTNTMIIFAGLGVIGFICSLALRVSERKGKGTGLELPTKVAQA